MLAHKLGCHSLSHPGGSARAPAPVGAPATGAQLRATYACTVGGQEGDPQPPGSYSPQPPPTCWGVFASAKSRNIFSSHFLGADSP